jgi:hypothetical protein
VLPNCRLNHCLLQSVRLLKAPCAYFCIEQVQRLVLGEL